MKKKKKASSNAIKIAAVIIGIVVFSAAIAFIAAASDRETFTYGILTTGLTAILVPIVTSLVDNSKKKKAAKKAANEREKRKKEELENLDTEKLDTIINCVKERSAERAYRINADKSVKPELTDSKFGGLPYWPSDMEYPTDKYGEKLVLLAQINFDKAKLYDHRLPKHGILQFFISTDELSGVDFEDPTSQENFRVIYHAEPDRSVTEESVRALGVKASTDFDFRETNLPFTDEYKLSFEEITDYMTCSVDDFDALVANIIMDCFGEELSENSVWKHFNDTEFNYLTDALDTTAWGHKMLGYPSFTQSDPRNGDDYKTLLLQVDSQDDIMWGDCGIANFFINEKDLKKLDFSKVFYSWDCY